MFLATEDSSISLRGGGREGKGREGRKEEKKRSNPQVFPRTNPTAQKSNLGKEKKTNKEVQRSR